MDIADDYSWESQKMWHITRVPVPPVLIIDTAWAQIEGRISNLEQAKLGLAYKRTPSPQQPVVARSTDYTYKSWNNEHWRKAHDTFTNMVSSCIGLNVLKWTEKHISSSGCCRPNPLG